MKTPIYFLFLVCIVLFTGCKEYPKTSILINTDVVISEGYIGNGVQWDPYQLDYGQGCWEISDSDWEKMYARLDFMQPQFIRVMINTTSNIKQGKLVPENNISHISKILDYCQSRGVTVMFGDWGGGLVDSKKNTINNEYIRFAAEYINYLINNKGYGCIKYYNLINEPNGFWSSTDGDYSLWACAIKCMYNEMKQLDLIKKVSIVGPDAAIWTDKETWWVDSCATYLRKQIGLYDIHTYPSKVTVNSGEYTKIIKAYKQNVPTNEKIVMGEIGFKYIEPADSMYAKENRRRIEAYKYASAEDSQMFVYDYMYGTDMADALFQTINSGFSGSIAWMLDDAMHAKEAPDKLKIWGFWNIFGEEYFGEQEENVRPWYYAWSLLCKYIPNGAKVYEVKLEGDNHIRAIAVSKGDKYMIGVVNVDKEFKKCTLKSSSLSKLEKMKQFIYSKGTLQKDGDHNLLPNKENIVLELRNGYDIEMPEESLIIYTNYEY